MSVDEIRHQTLPEEIKFKTNRSYFHRIQNEKWRHLPTCSGAGCRFCAEGNKLKLKAAIKSHIHNFPPRSYYMSSQK